MLNYQITFPQVTQLAKESEKRFADKFSEIYNTVIQQNPAVVLISGPSCSGKTTFSNMLAKRLSSVRPASSISIDDFFYDEKDRKNIKSDNLESIELVDDDLLYYCVSQLLSGEPTHMPSFDFTTRRRTFSGQQKILKKDELIIVEGIHALCPKIIDVFKNYKTISIYISVDGEIEFEDGFKLDGREIRKLRRIVRDHLHRDTTPEETLDLWEDVVISEKRFIEKSGKNADFRISSFLEYEPYIIKKPLLKALELIDDGGKYSYVKEKYLPMVKKLCAASVSLIPDDSVLHEFFN